MVRVFSVRFMPLETAEAAAVAVEISDLESQRISAHSLGRKDSSRSRIGVFSLLTRASGMNWNVLTVMLVLLMVFVFRVDC